MEHYLGQILKFEDFGLTSIYKHQFDGKLIQVVRSPDYLPPDPYHSKCERTCVLAKTCLCDHCKCLYWQRKDNTNIVYVFVN